MTIGRERIGDVIVLKPGDRLNVSTAPVLDAVVDKLYETEGCKVLIDLEDVSYVSSIGLSTCLKSAHLAQARGGHLALSGLRDAVREVVELAGLEKVLAILPSRDVALAAFGWVQPKSATGSSEVDTGLTLPEEILLLALRDEGGSFVDLPDHALDFALAGAVLMELCRRHRIDIDVERVVLVDPTSIGDALLDPALDAVARSTATRGPDSWVKTLAHEGDRIRARVVERLVQRGILRHKAGLLHWMLGGRRYPLAQDTEQREVKNRVLAVLASGEVPGPKDVAVIALADACAVFDAVIPMDDLMDLRPRIAEVARMDLVAQAMTRALGDMQSWGKWEGPPAGIWGATADASS